MLDKKQYQHQHQQHRRQLARRKPVTERKPGAINRRGKRLQAEVGRRTVVGDRFHQCQQRAGGNCRTRQRQVHAPPRLPRRLSEAARRVHHRRRARQERGAREQIHIRIKHDDEYERRACQRSNLGKPVVAALPAETVSQELLQRSGVLQIVGVRIRDDVRRHRQRQQQCPLESPAADEVARRHQPGGGSAHRDDADHDDQTQQRRLEQRRRNDRRQQVPQRVGRLSGAPEAREHAEHRQARPPRRTRSLMTAHDPARIVASRRNAKRDAGLTAWIHAKKPPKCE